ncbi:actinorhodin polyketide synthase acyl carrier protein [Streptomyces varsoviensis]|uniref:Actinorhodin polyketide synthase acyl carrier protein n=1 Tax=Streptomyces varsoviensis TaxID=67373 RepID=A0ABR5J2Z4_9ACTN|nr:actinorhodin polyketide synthase acyl carrier protein [Streptomyces varsoviensis]
MAALTLDELKQILRESAGEDESVDLSGDVLDVPFIDIGYDSLALLETAGRVERIYGVTLVDDAVSEAETPRVRGRPGRRRRAGAPGAFHAGP